MNSPLPYFRFLIFLLTGFCFIAQPQNSRAQETPTFQYRLSFPEPASNSYQVDLQSSGWQRDTLILKIPQWMPGYYQLMDYGKAVGEVTALDATGQALPVQRLDDHRWRLTGSSGKEFSVSYQVKTTRKFVATSYVDTERAYIIPGNSFLYVEGYLELPVSVEVEKPSHWPNIATGLYPVPNNENKFTAANFDILYDSPLLIGNLEELPPFEIDGIPHRFIGYEIGKFDHKQFMGMLKKITAEAIKIIDDIPYDRYTYIGIGPGRGGIEHLNNTTISFDGSLLHQEKARNTMMNFLAHEYFHHFNAKRIRPFELGPFDYDGKNRTYLLWISEGLTSYFEYLIVKRAGISDEEALFSSFESHINTLENNPGRLYQSLAESSYSTWEDGPFGNQGKEKNRTISYYQKGPIIGLLLDIAIRDATDNVHSLDDVMHDLYWTFYKEENRGFTGAEFQQVCEKLAGKNLDDIFEYVYTTKEIDYNTHLRPAGLQLELVSDQGQKKSFELKRLPDPTPRQKQILDDWVD